MNRIDNVFTQNNKKILSIYFTAGFPQLDDTMPILQWVQQYGADMVELGMPFSDPLADGPVIQHSSTVALKNGMSLSLLFDQLKNMRSTIHIPVLLMGYFNPVYQYGFEKFCKSCAEVGVDGFIIPDLPVEEYRQLYQPVARNYGLYHVLLVTPQTSEERIRYIDSVTEGFLYAVSSYSTTGGSKSLNASEPYFQRLASMHLKHPVMVGFGIRDKETFSTACRFARGGIIGTAFIRTLEQPGKMEENIRGFIRSVLD
ncbi:MAG TPA: tryptophan synthase subunit alpha [Bacteroidales bacterium]|nr:tryptophan synthase subunit alpha [Bacteroidales bacterium]